MSDPLEAVRVLLERLGAEAEALGLHMEHAALIPSTTGGPDFIQGVFVMKPESLAEPKSDDQLEVDKMFEEMARAERRADEDKKKESIKDDVMKWLNE